MFECSKNDGTFFKIASVLSFSSLLKHRMQQFKEKTGIFECIPTNIWPSCFVRAVVKNRIFFHLFRTVRTLSERYGQLKEDFQNVQESHRNHSDPDGITKQLQSTIDLLKIVARTAQQRLYKFFVFESVYIQKQRI